MEHLLHHLLHPWHYAEAAAALAPLWHSLSATLNRVISTRRATHRGAS